MRHEFRNQVLNRIANTLLLKAPRLERTTAEDVAIVLFYNMKTMVRMTQDKSAPASPGGPGELRLMNRIYLNSKLAGVE